MDFYGGKKLQKICEKESLEKNFVHSQEWLILK